MGVYIIKSIHSEWIKIGHHKITARRPTVYHRYINRGFYSCICPEEIKDKVSFNDVKLLYWFPNLDINDERKIHDELNLIYEHCGEWYKDLQINEIVNIITSKYKGISE